MKKRPSAYGLYDPSFEKESCGVGFVAQIKAKPSHQLVEQAGQILRNMEHRGAVGSEKNTGDGAGILLGFPVEFLEREAGKLGLVLPERGAWAAGIVFLSKDAAERQAQKKAFQAEAAGFGQAVLGWREVPRDEADLGPSARASEPAMEMVFLAAGEGLDQDAFEARLFLLRKKATHEIRGKLHDTDDFFYVVSLSSRVLVYKGMLKAGQLFDYFRDLRDPALASHCAMVHSRFSTNTFPSWDRAQPLRFMCHNGEINTLRGNVNKMKGRESTLSSPRLGPGLPSVFPMIEPDLSDSGCFDNVLELLYQAGRSLPESVMMMIPEAWQNQPDMDPDKRAFYRFQSAVMEPWDGPASIVFTDGRIMGAVLDRNGLRPSRFCVTEDDLVVMASEVGVLPIPPEKIRLKGRLRPGRMFLVDFEQGRIVDDEELKSRVAGRRPYRRWLAEQAIELDELDTRHESHGFHPETILERLRMFGYSFEHIRLILKPMAATGQEPLGSMGNDMPLACLSDKPRLVYDYFKQLFAQVTNPPIDSIREDVVMSLEAFIGPERNLLEESPGHGHRLHMPSPFLTNEQLTALKHLDHRGWKSRTLDMSRPAGDFEKGLVETLDRLCDESEAAIDAGYSLIILSDREAGPGRAPVGALLATGAVHQRLVGAGKRTRIGLVLESGEPREVHHFCMLVGFGADAVNPYLAFEVMWKMQRDGNVGKELSDEAIIANYIKANEKGMKKVFGKMGISTLESYKGSQIFEAVGLGAEVMLKCFAGTPSRIGGIGFEVLAGEAARRHELAYPKSSPPIGGEYLNFGDYAWRREGEKHMWDPESIANLQMAVRYERRDCFDAFSAIQNARGDGQATLRGLLRFKAGRPVPLEEVEPVSSLVKRFATGAMSYGSISKEAHETLAVAMNRLGGRSNTGEGGEDPARFQPLENGDSKRSAIKQIASGRFGVTIHYLANADEIQIKMAQGAKPGEGGELPGHKVFDDIARVRHSTPGVGLISPPPHHDIYSIEDLAQLIFDLKNANPQARISVKLVSEVGVGTVAAGVAKAHADHILISGHDGGTGASPLTGIKHAGLPWELGLAETHQTLVMNDLRSRVVLQTDGQLKTGRDVVMACLLGAEEFGFATSALVTLGCVMMRKCELNTCPVGIATQDPLLRAKFAGKPEYVMRFLTYVAEDARVIMAELGFRTIEEMVGRVDLLEPDPAVLTEKSRTLDLSALLAPARKKDERSSTFHSGAQEHAIAEVMDRRLIELADDAIRHGAKIALAENIRNTDRAVGTMLSNGVALRYGEAGLPRDTIRIKFSGSAGQSFGAWAAAGVSLELEGDANDYFGKGLSGGRLAVYPPRSARFAAEDNMIIGNVAFYGAIRGEAFVRGKAAERFCVRNSGACIVVEGVGDHGCEYMTGGRVVIIGETGRNFAAGMSGGIAYVWDRDGSFPAKVNRGMVETGGLEDDQDDRTVLDLLRSHAELTGSPVAEKILSAWPDRKKEFVKVLAPEYRRVLSTRFELQLEAVNG